MMHSEKVREFTANEFETEVLKSDLPVIVDFYSTECPPCEAVAPKFDGLAELYGDHVRFLKIFRQGNRELADQLNVRSSPTLLFFKGGKEVDERLIGAIRRAAIGASLDKLVSTEIAQRIAENQRPSTTETDLLIIGGGPAGLTAGIYAAQAKLKVIGRGFSAWRWQRRNDSSSFELSPDSPSRNPVSCWPTTWLSTLRLPGLIRGWQQTSAK